MKQYLTIAEDIEWLHQRWWIDQERRLSDAELRRGSTTLRQLLPDGTLQAAWRKAGFEKQPTVVGPDLLRLIQHYNLKLEQIGVAAAGGARRESIDVVGQFTARTDNASTGKSWDADEGFSVLLGYVGRDVRNGETNNHPLSDMIYRTWFLNEYLDSASIVSEGQIYSRRDVIQYVANYAGGVHLDRIKESSNRRKSQQYQKMSEIERRLHFDRTNSIYYELLSIGQSVGKSVDILNLAATIRSSL